MENSISRFREMSGAVINYGPLSLLSTICLFPLLTSSIGQKQDEEVCDYKFEIKTHRPCSSYAGPRDERIRFPDTDSTVIVREPKCGCYRITGGEVDVFKTVKTSGLYLHTELTMGGSHSQEKACIDRDENGCGGIGSCIYCNVCKQYSNEFLRLDHGSLDCNKYWSPDKYRNISLSICPPSKLDILKTINHKNLTDAEIIFKDHVGRKGGINVRLVARLYDQEWVRPDDRLNQLNSTELRFRNWYTKNGMIACHYFKAVISQ